MVAPIRLALLLALSCGVTLSQPAVLSVYWSQKWTDNAVIGNPADVSTLDSSYTYVDGDLAVVSNVSQAGLVPLNLWALVNGSESHHMTTASEQGNAFAIAAGFKLVGVQGYVFASRPSDGSGLPLEMWFSSSRNDHFLVGTSQNRQNAISAGYVLQYVDCYTSAPWILWPNTAPADIPFPLSTDLVGFTYALGNNAVPPGVHADTWYPSWATDGKLYSSWTDGNVNGVSSSSGGGAKATTGYAIITGEDPFNLTITGAATWVESTLPYQGRYPSLNVMRDGVWYYGTYALENYGSWPSPAPDCGNWCIQGPFCSIRAGTLESDGTVQWADTRRNMTSYSDNLFSETAFNNSKVKFGAPHAVDFGQNGGGMDSLYIIGHGAEYPTSHQSWMQGDSVYMARTVSAPDPNTINSASSWEFYGGGHGANAVWVPSIASAKPLFVWPGKTGVVTLSYHAAVGKYIMVISTPSSGCSTVGNFDTYFLEGDSLTGPWSYVTYLSAFGPEAYFVNIPTKFMGNETLPHALGVNTPLAAAVDHAVPLTSRDPIVRQLHEQESMQLAGTASWYNFFLSYSADFASGKPNPPGSGYHWSLQQSRFGLTPAFAEKVKQRGQHTGS